MMSLPLPLWLCRIKILWHGGGVAGSEAFKHRTFRATSSEAMISCPSFSSPLSERRSFIQRVS